jgi:ribosomal-protein-alanine N-acetyltransferase
MNAQLKDDQLPTLRPMRFDDVEAVLAIEHRIYPFPWTLGNFRDSLGSGYSCWTCDFRAQTVGYGIMMLAAGEAHLLNLGVAHDWQGQGLGRKFLRHLIEVARQDGADMMFLEVRPSNDKAIGLYLSEGFNEIGLRRNYYPAANGREDAILMGMAL